MSLHLTPTHAHVFCARILSTLHDNFNDLSKCAACCTLRLFARGTDARHARPLRFNKLVLAVNFITLGVFVITQLYFGAREYWCIDAFDMDVSLPGDNLLEELELYPECAAESASALSAHAPQLC